MTQPLKALVPAMERSRSVLFDPFDPKKYLAIALCAWLYLLGTAGGSGSSGIQTDTSGWDPAMAEDASAWVIAHAMMFVFAGLVVLAVVIGVWAAILFLQSRGTFMLIDNIVHDRGEIAAPWRQLAPQANALFRFNLTVSAIAAAASLLITGGGVVLTWQTWPGSFTTVPLAIALTSGFMVATLALIAGVTTALADDLVAPLMFVRRYTIAEGFSDLRAHFRHDPSGLGAYLVLRFVANIAVGLLGAALVVLSCGLALLPFMSTVLLLPLIVAVRSFSLEYLAQSNEDVRAALEASESAEAG